VLAPELLAEDADGKGGARACQQDAAVGHEQDLPSGGRGVDVGVAPQCRALERQQGCAARCSSGGGQR